MIGCMVVLWKLPACPGSMHQGSNQEEQQQTPGVTWTESAATFGTRLSSPKRTKHNSLGRAVMQPWLWPDGLIEHLNKHLMLFDEGPFWSARRKCHSSLSACCSKFVTARTVCIASTLTVHAPVTKYNCHSSPFGGACTSNWFCQKKRSTRWMLELFF